MSKAFILIVGGTRKSQVKLRTPRSLSQEETQGQALENTQIFILSKGKSDLKLLRLNLQGAHSLKLSQASILNSC